MKSPLLLMCALMLGACSPIGTKPDEVATALTVRNTNQHVAAASLLGVYYCDQGRWPQSITELRDTHEPMPLPVEVDWTWLAQPGSSLKVDEHSILTLTTPAGVQTGDVQVSSIHAPPGCAPKKVELRVHINLGS